MTKALFTLDFPFLKSQSFTFFMQYDAMDCGAACLRMVAHFYGHKVSQTKIRALSFVNREGVSMMGLSRAAEAIRFETLSAKIKHQDFKAKTEQWPLPAILHWEDNHFVVLMEAKENSYKIADPAKGVLTLDSSTFFSKWNQGKSGKEEGVVLFLSPEESIVDSKKSKASFWPLFKPFLGEYKSLFAQVFLGLMAGVLISLLLPFLFQAVIDWGIGNEDIHLVILLLVGQLVLFSGQIFIEFLRNWILLFIGTNINISLISGFLKKVMKLKVSFFETRIIGDLLQRINDHYRIEHFITITSLSSIFSLINLVVFGLVLAVFKIELLLVYVLLSFFFFSWIFFFLKKRRLLDQEKFEMDALERSKLIEIYHGIEDIKLHGAGRIKRGEWEDIQQQTYGIEQRSLWLEQYQSSGANLINELKNALITLIVAKAVIDGEMSIGMMMSVQFIIGQLNGPMNQFVGFLQEFQDARISFDRMNELDEEPLEESIDPKIANFPSSSLRFEKVGFWYGSQHMKPTLSNLSFVVPVGKTTAIVGESGSGKSTILKLMLRFYEPSTGVMECGDYGFFELDLAAWRQKCGVVNQNGFLFEDTLLKNIALGDSDILEDRVVDACKKAALWNFIEELPLGLNTKCGSEGVGFSAGQKQRILIARAFYRQADYLFLDEATNALDATTEKEVLENIKTSFMGKTVVIIAHRLSSIKDADQILVMSKGSVVENGNHNELLAQKGYYASLVKHQM